MKIDGRRIFEVTEWAVGNVVKEAYHADVLEELAKLSQWKLEHTPDGQVSEGFNEKYVWLIMKKDPKVTMYYKERKDIKETDRAEWLRDELIKSGEKKTADFEEVGFGVNFYNVLENSETSIELRSLEYYIEKRGKDAAISD